MTEKHTKGSMSLSTERVQNGYHHVLMIASELTAVGAVYGSTNAMWDSVPGAVEGEANARRIVACWNACDGMSTETLEGALGAPLVQGGFVGLWSDYCDKKAEAQDLREQVDQLLVYLQGCVQHMEWSTPQGRRAHDAANHLLREHALHRAQAEASTSAPAPGKLPGNATN